MAHEPNAPILDDTQLLLLDTLIYRFDREVTVAPGQMVSTIVRDLDSGLKERMNREDARMGTLVGEQMTFAQWFAVVDAVRRDSDLCRVRLDAYHSDDRGAKMACFSDGDTADDAQSSAAQAISAARQDKTNAHRRGYVILAGTGSGEWPDNCSAAYLADSEQQLRALSWFEQTVIPRGYEHTIASGHSKGGNKAMYLAVQEPDALDAVVSFDGQGFSRQFLAAYEPAIRENAGKIRAYALDNDFVNGLLNPICPAENRIFLKGEHEDIPFAYHAPFSLLAPAASDPHRLTLRAPGRQDRLGQLSAAFTDYMQSETDDHDFRHVCNYLGELLECTTRSSWADAERRQQLVELSKSPDLALTAKYLTDFLRSVGQDVTVRDVRLALLGGGTDESLDPQTLAAIAMAKLPAPLQNLFNGTDKAPDTEEVTS